MNALFNISYGIYILTAKDEKNNGCVINTLMQVTSNPNQISVTVNKDNNTTKIIEKTGVFNVSVLDQTTSFDLIKRFGFQSGKNVDKFEGFNDYKIAQNGVAYITKNVNCYLSAKVNKKIDVGTHYIFVAELVDSQVISMNESATYAYYFSNIKPKTEVKFNRVYVCRICGYVYQGEKLPEDYICPICKHGAEAFDLVEQEQPKEKKVEQKTNQKQYYCSFCGNIEKGENVDKCIICNAKMIEF